MKSSQFIATGSVDGVENAIDSVNIILIGICFNSKSTILMANKNAQSERFSTYIIILFLPKHPLVE